MRILFFVYTPYPNGMASTKRIKSYCKGLSLSGDKCFVYVCHKYFQSDEKKTNGINDSGIFGGIPYRYVVGKFKAKSKIIRGLDYFILDQLRASWFAFKNIKRGDTVYCYFNDLFFSILLLSICKIKMVKVVKELCEYPYVFGRQGVKKKILRAVELRFFYPIFDGFVAISSSLEKLANRYKKRSGKVIRVPILVEESFISNDELVKSRLNYPYILHSGTMDEKKDGIKGILEAFSFSLNKIPENVKLVFTGPHAVKPNEYDEVIERLGIVNKVQFLGMVEQSELIQLQYYADLAIINKVNNLQNENCFPTKLGEMLISETPVITTAVGDIPLFLKDGFDAYIVEPGNPMKIAQKIQEAFEFNLERKRIGLQGKITCQKEFNSFNHGKKMSDFFKTL